MNEDPKASRFLEATILASFVIHGLGIVSMGLVLLRGLPGGPAGDVATRAAFVADHPWLWRLGWLPWHLSAAIDVVLALALLATPWVPLLPAWLTLLVTLAAVAPEQTGEVAWVSRGVALARAGDLAAYEAFEAWAYHLVVVVASSLYLLMALGWTWCFAAAGTWSRVLTWVSALAWGTLAVGSVGLLLPEGLRPGAFLAGAANGVGFLLLEVWFILVGEQVLRRSRPDGAHGRLAPWRHPWRGPAGRLAEAVANSRFVRFACEWLPVPGFKSDITDVLYVNYMVEAERLAPLVPPGLDLLRRGPGGRFALFSFLSYRHGHFGPAFLGPLRRLLPSPVQTNWRVYLRDLLSGREGIYFVTNAIDSTAHALGARLLSEGMPMHVLARAEVTARPDGTFLLDLDPGAGSAPDARAELRPAKGELPQPWRACWESYGDFLLDCVPKDRALSAQPWYGRLTSQEIHLGIQPADCEPLEGEVRSRAAAAVVGEVKPVCFRVAKVAFRFTGEQRGPLAPP
jgi:hypothetical protein